MGTQSFPKHLKGRAATPANVEATIYPSTDGGTELDFATDRAAEVAAERGITAEDLEGLVGTGKDGAITVADVKNWSKEPEEG
jgi:pyruvate/2-oxoglutarate dehydrogenase complex dihydrolipoamide acyltransferase (E2) component